MTDSLTTWDEIRQLADELDVKVHLARMELRDRWHELEPRLEKLEVAIAKPAERAGESLTREMRDVRDALRALRDDVFTHARGDYVRGW